MASNRGNYKKHSGVGVVGLEKASFLFSDGFLVQFEGDAIKIKDMKTNEVWMYKNEGKLFPDAMNAMDVKRKHFEKPQLLFKDE